MRQLVPRRGRRAGLGRLAAAGLVAVAISGCLGAEDGSSDKRSDALLNGSGLSIAIAEGNPNLFSPGRVPRTFQPWRDRVDEMRPALYRLLIDWAHLQPKASQPAELAAGVDGCMREIRPCAPYLGVRDTLRALAALQKAAPGWAVVVTIYGVPDWAAVRGFGCERPSIQPRSRAISAAGLRGYRALIRQLVALGDELGVELRFWSPWNEPNEVFFISPQRARCDVSSPALSPAVYSRIFKAASEELDKAPGDQQLVLGDLAGPERASKRAAGVSEFLRALPDDVVCEASVLAQHQYVDSPIDAVGEATAAVDERSCDRSLPVWITESGVGGEKAGNERPLGRKALAAQCRRYHQQLIRWQKNRRIKAVVQYTVREDPGFRVGLVDPELDRAYPTFGLLTAWSRRPSADRAPKLPSACG